MAGKIAKLAAGVMMTHFQPSARIASASVLRYGSSAAAASTRTWSSLSRKSWVKASIPGSP